MNRSLNFRRPPVAACLAAAAIVFAPAVPASPLPTARVYVGDLDLKTSDGQRVAQQRIAIAIEEVCAVRGAIVLPTMRTRIETRKCREQAFASVQAQLEQHGLPKLPARKHG